MQEFSNEWDYLIHLVRCAIHDQQPQELPDSLDFQRVYEYGVYHHIANIAFYSVQKLERKPKPELYAKWNALKNQAIVREINQSYARDEIMNAFQQASIRWLEVQGTKIKPLYPQPDFRTMSDIDFIIDSENLPKAQKLLEGLGYTCQLKPGIEVDGFRKPNINIEIHAHYFHPDTDFHNILPLPFSSGSDCTIHDFYAYNMLHIMKHYLHGGCGIRRILDIYFLNHHYGNVIERNYVRSLLDSAGVADQVEMLSSLANKWFGADGCTGDTSEAEFYIQQSGLHGQRFHQLHNRLDKTLDTEIPHAKTKYLLRRLVGTKEIMYASYPVLNKHKLLYPFCWLHRAARVLQPKKRKIIQREIQFVAKKQRFYVNSWGRVKMK